MGLVAKKTRRSATVYFFPHMAGGKTAECWRRQALGKVWIPGPIAPFLRQVIDWLDLSWAPKFTRVRLLHNDAFKSGSGKNFRIISKKVGRIIRIEGFKGSSKMLNEILQEATGELETMLKFLSKWLERKALDPLNPRTLSMDSWRKAPSFLLTTI